MATQKGRNWSSGDIVTAANLSSIERGVSAVAEEYTPTTWTNGNTVTATGLNNIEQGIVNAGGGSSDLSTAEVTVVNSLSTFVSITFYGAIGDYSEDFDFSPNTLPNCVCTKYAEQSRNTTEVYNLALYEEHGIMSMNSSYTVSVTGNIELLMTEEEYVIYDITGDCTITVLDSPEQPM